MTLVADLMTQNPHTLAPHHKVYHAYATMEMYRLRHVPVLNDQGKLVGIVSDRDLKRHLHNAFGHQEGDFLQDTMHTDLQAVMALSPQTTTPETTVIDALRTMMEQRISCLPVLDEKHQLVGILTDTDLLHLLAQKLEESAA